MRAARHRQQAQPSPPSCLPQRRTRAGGLSVLLFFVEARGDSAEKSGQSGDRPSRSGCGEARATVDTGCSACRARFALGTSLSASRCGDGRSSTVAFSAAPTTAPPPTTTRRHPRVRNASRAGSLRAITMSPKRRSDHGGREDESDRGSTSRRGDRVCRCRPIGTSGLERSLGSERCRTRVPQ